MQNGAPYDRDKIVTQFFKGEENLNPGLARKQSRFERNRKVIDCLEVSGKQPTNTKELDKAIKAVWVLD